MKTLIKLLAFTLLCVTLSGCVHKHHIPKKGLRGVCSNEKCQCPKPCQCGSACRCGMNGNSTKLNAEQN